MPPLPETLYFDAGKRVDSDEVFVTFGLVDDPDHQSQMTHKLNITAMNYMLIGSTQTGKTNFLQTAIRSLTEHYSPDEVNIYIVDFASMILKNFENLNHVGGVVLSHEDEKVKNLFRLLSNEIDLRKSRLAEVGVSSFASYKEAGHFGWNYLWKYHKTFSMLEDSIGYICPNKLSKEEEIPEISNGLKKTED
jgi:S-DNA-T family DNA segregation ATPase FtsK/SpoIIIE